MAPVPRIFRPVANCSECWVRYSHGTNQCENGFAYKWTGTAPSSAQLTSLAQEVGQTIGAKMRNFMHGTVVFREVYCRNLDVATANQGTWTFPNNTVGLRGGSAVASNEAAGVVKRTGLTGRSKRGRNSFSEFVEGDVDGNTLSSQLMGLIADLILSIVAQRVGGLFTPAVASRKLGTAQVLATAVQLDSNVDSQKTRLNNHGD